MTSRWVSRVSIALASVLALFGCSGGGGGGGSGGGGSTMGDGELVLEVTDKAFVYDIVEVARISIDEVRIHTDSQAEEGDEGWIVLYDDVPVDFNLLELHNGVKRVLLHADLEPASYANLRLHVSSAYLKLVNGNEYSTELGNLKLTSQDTSGFKVIVEPPIEVVSELSKTLLLDFDLTKTFHPIPASDPLNADHYMLQPVIHASNLSEAGELRGVVTALVDGVQQPQPEAAVYVLLPGETNLDNALTSTATDDDGAYAVLGLAPGVYDVVAQKDDLDGRVEDVTITVANVTVADVVIE
jgi:hypothetical protein